MADLPKDPTPQQLLDRLVQIECKLVSRIMKLEAENERLKACIVDGRAGFDVFMAATENTLVHVYELLWPLVDKVFPKLHEMQSRIDAIVPPRYADPRADRRRDNAAE